MAQKMTSRRRTEGDETWTRLLNWTNGQKASERLSGHILACEGFGGIDPSQPLGGSDGLRDLMCFKNNLNWIAACYFPNGKKPFSRIKSKFEHDAKSITTDGTSGFVFITNQYLTIGQRKNLETLLPATEVEIYHLERLVHILDTPINYGIRLEFLDIEMTKEEQVAFFSIAMTKNWQRLRDELLMEMERLINRALSQQS